MLARLRGFGPGNAILVRDWLDIYLILPDYSWWPSSKTAVAKTYPFPSPNALRLDSPGRQMVADDAKPAFVDRAHSVSCYSALAISRTSRAWRPTFGTLDLSATSPRDPRLGCLFAAMSGGSVSSRRVARDLDQSLQFWRWGFRHVGGIGRRDEKVEPEMLA
jgi:hypothetical protein